MSLPDFYKTCFKQVYVLESVQNHPATRQVHQQLQHLPWQIVAHKAAIPSCHQNQYTLLISAPQVPAAGRCPGSKGHICCNYLTLDLYTGCTIGCTYCIMQSYLNFSPISVNVALEETIAYVIGLAKRNPDTVIRIGTGEVGDSLLYDPLFQLSAQLITAFAPYRNISLELKTKTSFVQHLLSLESKGNAVIGFSLNPEPVVASEEGRAAPLTHRIDAARAALQAGYRVAFHFDPMFYYPDWEEDYSKVIRLLQSIPQTGIAWISLGTFRYTPGLKAKIAKRWYLYNEFILCRDKKYRYIQQLRCGIYRKMLVSLKTLFPAAPVYLCMESKDVWEKVFLQKPGKIHELYDIIKRVEL